MSQAAKAQEPSMEEILASIRRIIADDETEKPAANSSAANSSLNGAGPDHGASESGEPAGGEAMSEDDIENMLDDLGSSPDQDAANNDASRHEDGDVLELTPAMEARGPDPDPAFRSIDGGHDLYFSEASPDPEPPRSMHFDHQFSEEEPFKQLLSDQATAAVTSAFGSLAHTVLAQNARTLDDLVREMLRPMLKGWLDDNLPTIVERLVRAEIERVSRGRG